MRHRIQLLDSFRCIAIICVMLFHYTDLPPTISPYGDFFRDIFGFGYIGVPFFYMISGFVISYTLENTPDLLSFHENRFSRLFPPMLLCTLLTFIIMRCFDDHYLFRNAHEIKNFLPSLTFTNPSIWTLLTKINFHWINSSYWSLWVEIQFYIISSCLYFLNKRNFLRNMLLTGIAISLIKYIPDYFLNNHTQYLKQNGLITLFKGWRYSDEMFNITFFITWFLPGVMFYHLYKGLQLKKNIFIGICCVGMIYCLLRDIRNIYVGSLYTVIFATLLMFALFSIMIYRKKYLLFLEISFLKRVGIISYTIYLIHEDIGILLISKFGKYLGNWGALWPFIVIFLAIGFAELSYRFYERKANIFLKKIFNNRGKIFLNKHIADTS